MSLLTTLAFFAADAQSSLFFAFSLHCFSFSSCTLLSTSNIHLHLALLTFLIPSGLPSTSLLATLGGCILTSVPAADNFSFQYLSPNRIFCTIPSVLEFSKPHGPLLVHAPYFSTYSTWHLLQCTQNHKTIVVCHSYGATVCLPIHM